MEQATLFILLFSGLLPLPLHSTYHLVQQQKTWAEAQSHCREKFTDLVTVFNIHENQELLKAAGNSDFANAWIGLYDDIYTWKTSEDQSYVTMRSGFWWHAGQPDPSGHYCLVVNNRTAELANVHCSSKRRFLCYDANNSSGLVLVETRANWSEAQTYCRKHHTDLANVRSREEQEEVLQAVRGAGEGWIWIGLDRDPWVSWSDNRPSTFHNWDVGQPNERGLLYCVKIKLTSGKWAVGNCNNKKPFFCFEAPTKLTTLRMRMKSEADLNNLEVQQQLLKQLTAHMTSKGMTNFQLRWRKVHTDHEDEQKNEEEDETAENGNKEVPTC